MKTGLVLGKFYPFHTGHMGLIEFARHRCDRLIILICASDNETVAGYIRLKWMEETYRTDENIKLILVSYSESELPNTSVASKAVSNLWANKIRDLLPETIDIFFSSEPYGEFLATYLTCNHIVYDLARHTIDISGTQLRAQPLKYWNFLAPSTRPYYVKKICITGTESTGKSTMAEKLATTFKTEFVPEMAREIISETDDCTELHLIQIAELHAKTIQKKLETANRFLFVDTDLNITRSYSRFLFNKELQVDHWVEIANHFDLYLFLEKDAPYIQDGTRLDKQRRNDLNNFHKRELDERNIKYEVISGNWEERFAKAVTIIQKLLAVILFIRIVQ